MPLLIEATAAVDGGNDRASVDAHFRLGVCRQVLGRHDLAVESYRAVLAIDPSFAMAHVNLGQWIP